MEWTVEFHEDFELEFQTFDFEAQDTLLARLVLLRELGPKLSRPYADTLKGSRHPNMKEIRFSSNGGVYRAAFAFDPKRRAIILVMGDKAGSGQKRFYTNLIAKADQRFEQHLKDLKNG